MLHIRAESCRTSRWFHFPADLAWLRPDVEWTDRGGGAGEHRAPTLLLSLGEPTGHWSRQLNDQKYFLSSLSILRDKALTHSHSRPITCVCLSVYGRTMTMPQVFTVYLYTQNTQKCRHLFGKFLLNLQETDLHRGKTSLLI